MNSRPTSEALVIVGLLVTTLVFGFSLLPMGIADGSGNQGAGLSAGFIPRVATFGIAIALGFGLFETLIRARFKKGTVQIAQEPDTHPFRAALAALVCLLAAYVVFAVAGFYIGGVLMGIVLLLLLGERRFVTIVVFPTLVLTVIYVIFELGLQVRLPKANLIPGLAL